MKRRCAESRPAIIVSASSTRRCFRPTTSRASRGSASSRRCRRRIRSATWAGPNRVWRAARVRGAYAWRALLDTGVTIPNGTDAPVEAVDTRRTFHAAIARENEANQPPGGWYPGQRMTRDEALRSMTIWAAHANFAESSIGSIERGKHADFTVLDRDWMTRRARSNHVDAHPRDLLRRPSRSTKRPSHRSAPPSAAAAPAPAAAAAELGYARSCSRTYSQRAC